MRILTNYYTKKETKLITTQKKKPKYCKKEKCVFRFRLLTFKASYGLP